MGQQQLLMIILGVIIVGVAVVAGIGMFNAHSEESTKDELASQCMVIGANAQQFYKRPIPLGGGGLSFATYVLPRKLGWTSGGTYSATAEDDNVTITGTPRDGNYHWHVTTTVKADTIITAVSDNTTAQ